MPAVWLLCVPWCAMESARHGLNAGGSVQVEPLCDIGAAWVLEGARPIGRVGYITGANNAT
eukprot:CAMPEP_0119317944 /NCGR_PEP_ID=MMETSP1333-20130426/44952_1 /TAXON_ID=418940 /ORGANISM="Scyphosphaera apsteinii, Strain RCC1455" /LENGTH=60 /DNA_ID=CAMNT_0007324023 /DNA_START=39 /DNA_END=217 /DNA_ORIENTATION=-